MKTLRILPLAAGAIFAAAGAFAQSAPDFSRYVSMGDSLTAGYQSGCLVERHQLRSYPAILATQLGHTVAGDGDSDPTHFQQPLISEPGIAACLQASLDPVTHGIDILPISNATGTPENLFYPAPYNNLAIPGATVGQLIDITTQPPDTSNPFFEIILRNTDSTTPLFDLTQTEEAIGLSPTFVTVVIGFNDVDDALLSGTAISDSCLAVNPAGGGSCDGITLTTASDFATSYTTLLQTLRGALPNATILVSNLSDIVATPFGTTVPPVVINPVTQQPVLDPSGNPIPLLGTDHSGNVIQIPPDTLVTLPALSLEATGFGIPCVVYLGAGEPPAANCDQPLPDGSLTPAGISSGVLLYSDEVALLHQRILDDNSAIATAAAEINAQMYDLYSVFNDVAANGRSYAGVHITKDFLTGGIFSYDGFHPTNIGHVLLTDEIIQWMNSTYGTSIPRPNVYAALFVPDVPPASDSPTNGGASASSNASPHFSLKTWQYLLDFFPPPNRKFQTIQVSRLFGYRAPETLKADPRH